MRGVCALCALYDIIQLLLSVAGRAAAQLVRGGTALFRGIYGILETARKCARKKRQRGEEEGHIPRAEREPAARRVSGHARARPSGDDAGDSRGTKKRATDGCSPNILVRYFFGDCVGIFAFGKGAGNILRGILGDVIFFNSDRIAHCRQGIFF